MAIAIILTFLLSCFAYFGTSQSTDRFIFNDFRKANLSLDGVSTLITPNGLLQLTDQTVNVTGHAFYPSPMFNNSLKRNNTSISSFSTSFVFGIIPSDQKKGGGHGFAFAISPSNQLSGGSSSHYLGLLNPSNDGKATNHLFAIEFDTVGAGGAFGDIDNNHVGVDVNSMISLESKTASYYGESGNTTTKINMENGGPIQVWIEYDGVNKFINVTLSPISVPRPSRPLISYKFDLSPLLVAEPMYVGFSAATSKLSSSHYILGWSFQVNGIAQELDRNRLPALPPVGESSSSFKRNLQLLVVIPVTAVMAAIAALLYQYRMQRKKQSECLEAWELDCPHRFRYKDLYIATKGFKPSEIIGVGGFGTVYKGVLPRTGEEIAVKRISHNSMQGVREFVAEIESLGRLRHKNLVHLLGWCKRKADLLLVYDFVPNGSLDAFLLNRRDDFVLSWERRFNIVKGIASALLYLHQDWEQVVVHRDIKASNVLLDVDMNGRLGDFGLARLYDHGDNPRTTHVVGTLGYIAPELVRIGKATASSDVFAYGTLLLVVACGKGPIDPVLGHLTLLDWVSECYRSDQIMDVVDPKLNSSYVIEELDLVLKLGLLCCHPKSDSRPSMRQVIRYLNGDDLLPNDDDASDAYLHLDSVKSIYRGMDPKNESTQLSQDSSYGRISTNSLEAGR
ncbi:hypothetical protein IFM89_012218 [Coptis chinensis]|uniref:non-specific serine/threonine protein kinase n=1 Tax=Coptis chinensis TaxID=261450 RepID=A0A835HDR4_9MAGN|nr:hypothetical protein IFM89_012218 [Coptis chinensis]